MDRTGFGAGQGRVTGDTGPGIPGSGMRVPSPAPPAGGVSR
jgi:hypothetical protein